KVIYSLVHGSAQLLPCVIVSAQEERRMVTRVLRVEDDPEIARLVRDVFVREGYDVTCATTGLEGWDDFKAEHYDLALIDVMLPEMDGFTLCKNIRWDSDIPLLIISAKKEDEDKVKGLDIGA